MWRNAFQPPVFLSLGFVNSLARICLEKEFCLKNWTSKKLIFIKKGSYFSLVIMHQFRLFTFTLKVSESATATPHPSNHAVDML